MLREQALAKMLNEMNEEHSSVEDAIHNYLCDQNDEKLFEGIMKDGRSIKGAMNYCINKAKGLAVNNAAMVNDDEVYNWVIEYFKADKVEKLEEVKAKVVKNDVKSNSKPNKKKTKIDNNPILGEQLSLF